MSYALLYAPLNDTVLLLTESAPLNVCLGTYVAVSDTSLLPTPNEKLTALLEENAVDDVGEPFPTITALNV